MKKIILGLAIVTLSTSVFGYDLGDKIRCFDDTTNETFTVKFTSKVSAYVKIQNREYPEYNRFYSAKSVRIAHVESTTYVEMIDIHNDVEEIELPSEIKRDGHGFGGYAGMGDSHAIECKMI